MKSIQNIQAQKYQSSKQYNTIFPQKNIIELKIKTFDTPCPLLRSACIEWFYKAQESFLFSKSTLFIAIGLLDKLLNKGLNLTQINYELVVGGILLISTKFNEVYPVTLRKINTLNKGEYSPNQFIEVQSAILENIDFTITLESIYESLTELEAKYQGTESQKVGKLIKMAILNPNQTFRFGPAMLLQAIQSLNQKNIIELNTNSNQYCQINTLRQSLSKMKSTNFKRLVSPARF